MTLRTAEGPGSPYGVHVPLRPRRIRRLLFLLALVSFVTTVEATRFMKARIHEFTVQGGKVAFVPPSGGFTVLDARTGTVLFRQESVWNESYNGETFTDTAHGLVVKSYRSGLLGGYTTVYRVVDLRRGVSVWEVANRPGCHVAKDHLICAQGPGLLGILRSRTAGARLVARRLVDGGIVWTYDRGGQRGEILDGKGRLMVTAEDEEWRWTEGAKYRSYGPARRVRSVSLLDVETGKEMLALQGLDVEVGGVPYGVSPIAFDGDRVVLSKRRPAGDPCAGRLLRVLAVNASITGFESADVCEPQAPAVASGAPASGYGTFAVGDGSLEIGADSDGQSVLLSFRSEQGSWRVRTPPGHVERAWDTAGMLFVEGESASFGTLDAIDLASGRPLWRHVYPSTWQLASTSGFARRASYLIQGVEAQRKTWEQAKGQPLQPPLRLDLPGTPAEPPVPVVRDPHPFGVASLARLRVAVWASLALPLLLAVALRRWRPMPVGALRRALLGVGLCLYMAAWLVLGSGFDQSATWAGKLAFAVAVMLALSETLRVRTRRVTWLARLCLALLTLAIGLGGLPLLFLA